MRMYDIIEKKKRNEELSRDEICEMIKLYTEGNIPDYQMSAFLMAVYFNGMSDSETSILTEAMANSGDTVDLSRFGSMSVDKHSTGGVGDKTTLIVAPIVAAAGGKVAKMSGRGLGHTGGTIDKLESFPGFHTSLSAEDFLSQVEKCSIAVVGQSADLAPADKKLYALRDVTATVDSIPLIASSIMSKKLASGSASIVLDVKYGSGAFMKTKESAEKLAEKMVMIGKSHGRFMAAVISDMDSPLGFAIGNTLEVCEAIEVLKGKGPEDLRELCLTLSSLMIEFSLGICAQDARRKAETLIEDGSAFEKLCEWLSAQGADASFAHDTSKFKKAKFEFELRSGHSGYISAFNAEAIGEAAMKLGAGREKKDDIIDHSAGIVLKCKKGDKIRAGEPLAILYSSDEKRIGEAAEILCKSVKFSSNSVEKHKIIDKIIT